MNQIVPITTATRLPAQMVISAREMQRAGAGIRSLAEPFLDTTSDFANIVLAILGVAAKLQRRPPIVQNAAYVGISNKALREQVEKVLIKFLKSNAVLNKQNVDR